MSNNFFSQIANPSNLFFKNPNDPFEHFLFKTKEFMENSDIPLSYLFLASELVKQSSISIKYKKLLTIVFLSILQAESGNLSGFILSKENKGSDFISFLLQQYQDEDIPENYEDFIKMFLEISNSQESKFFVTKPQTYGLLDFNSYKPIVFTDFNNEKVLYSYKMWNYEELLAKAIKDKSKYYDNEHQNKILPLIKKISSTSGSLELTEEQQQACIDSASASFSVITGGPGTGKTTIIGTLLRLFIKLYPDLDINEIAIAAPTGKAANRVMLSLKSFFENIDDEKLSTSEQILKKNPPIALTVHRLLAYSPGLNKYLHHKNNPTNYKIIIIDESSMLDLNMTYTLLSSSYNAKHIIFTGDAKQLPAVASLSVFSELTLLSEMYPVSVLQHSFRMKRSETGKGRNIYTVANKISNNNINLFFENVKSVSNQDPDEYIKTIHKPKYEGVELVRLTSELLNEIYDKKYKNTILEFINYDFALINGNFTDEDNNKLHKLFNDYSLLGILTVTNIYKTGKNFINEYFVKKHPLYTFKKRFFPGQPVILTENNYSYGLFNGDAGIIIKVKEEEQTKLKAVFPLANRKFILLNPELISGMESAYAITVHKSQGSEFDEILLILPENNIPLCTSELIYTGITRAKKSVVIAGKKDVLLFSVKNKNTKHTSLKQRLKFLAN